MRKLGIKQGILGWPGAKYGILAAMDDTHEKLKRSMDEAEWGWIKTHLQRDAVILVGRDLDLIEVGMRIARDDKAEVEEWVKRGLVSKPTREQVLAWDETPSKRFVSLVVQPFVLIQELLLH